MKPLVQVPAGGGRYTDAASIPNVPVMMPYTSGFGVHLSIQPGDFVLLVFVERGISNFKRTWGNSPPDKLGFFSRQDAIAIAGLGPMGTDWVPAVSDGVSIQKADGSIFVGLTDAGVSIVAPDASITARMTQVGNMTVQGDLSVNGTFTVNGVRVANANVRTGSASGPGSHSHDLTDA